MRICDFISTMIDMDLANIYIRKNSTEDSIYHLTSYLMLNDKYSNEIIKEWTVYQGDLYITI